MSGPLRDRLAQIIKAEAKKYPPGYDLDEGCRHIADALLDSEEWQAREAVVEAAHAYVQSDTATSTLETWHAMVDAVAGLAAGRGAAMTSCDMIWLVIKVAYVLIAATLVSGLLFYAGRQYERRWR